MNDRSEVSVTSIIASPATNELLAGTTDGIAKSGDAGRTWTLAGNQDLVLSLAEAQGNLGDGTLIAGLANGVASSHDAGGGWRQTLASSPVTAVAIATNSRDEFVGLAGTENDGLFRSNDGGSSWQPALAGLHNLEILCLGLSPRFADDDTVYAGTAQGLVRSRNSGKAWRPLPFPIDDVAVQALAISSDPGTLWAGTESRGLFVSRDGGAVWEECFVPDSNAVSAIALLDANVFVATDSALWHSATHDGTWCQLAELDGILSLLAVSEHEILAGTTGGICRIERVGDHWSAKYCAISPANPEERAASPRDAPEGDPDRTWGAPT